MIIHTSNIKSILFTFLTFISLPSPFFWYNNIILLFITSVWIYYFYFNKKKKHSIPNYIFIVFVLVVIYFCVFRISVLFQRLNNFNIFFLTFLLYKDTKRQKINVLKLITKSFGFVLLPSIIWFILSQFLPLPNILYGGLDGFYRNYFLFVTPQYSSALSSLLPRFQFIFTEPGILGSISFLLLLFNNFNFKNKVLYIILLAGLLSFSLFFYISVVLILILRNIKKTRNVLIVSTVFVIVFQITSNITLFQTYIYKRTQIVGNTISGNNRTSKVWDNDYANFKNSSDYFFGRGLGSVDRESFGFRVSSGEVFIYEFGIFGTLLVFTYLFLLSFRKVNFYTSIIFLLGTGMFFYTRPYIISYFFLIIFVGGIGMLSEVEKHSIYNIKSLS